MLEIPSMSISGFFSGTGTRSLLGFTKVELWLLVGSTIGLGATVSVGLIGLPVVLSVGVTGEFGTDG